LKLKAVIVIILIMGIASFAEAQYSAQLFTAETVMKGNSRAFANFGIYDHVRTIVGGYRYGIGGYTDAGFRLGYVDYDSGDDGFVLGGDMRYQLMEVRIQDPLDLSVGGLFETVLGIGSSNFSLGGFAVGSRAIALTKTKNLWPYGRLIMRWDHVPHHNEINIGLNAGASFEISPTTRVCGEFQFDDQFGFIIGLTFGL